MFSRNTEKILLTSIIKQYNYTILTLKTKPAANPPPLPFLLLDKVGYSQRNMHTNIETFETFGIIGNIKRFLP